MKQPWVLSFLFKALSNLSIWISTFSHSLLLSGEQKRQTIFGMQHKGVGESYLQNRGGVLYSCSWAFLPFSHSPDKILSSRHDIILPVSQAGSDAITPSDGKPETLCSHQTLITATESLLPIKWTQAWDKQFLSANGKGVMVSGTCGNQVNWYGSPLRRMLEILTLLIKALFSLTVLLICKS